MGLERAIAAIEHSIANGYQGIYEPKNGQTQPPLPMSAGGNPPIDIPDELIPPWDSEHKRGGVCDRPEGRWFMYEEFWNKGVMTGPGWWEKHHPLWPKWKAEQDRKRRTQA